MDLGKFGILFIFGFKREKKDFNMDIVYVFVVNL